MNTNDYNEEILHYISTTKLDIPFLLMYIQQLWTESEGNFNETTKLISFLMGARLVLRPRGSLYQDLSFLIELLITKLKILNGAL